MATKTKKTKTAKKGDINGQNFKAADVIPTDIYTPSANIPSISDTEAEQRSNQIDGQRRALAVATKNQGVVSDAWKLEAAFAATATEEVKAQTGWEKHRASLVMLDAAKVSTLKATERLTQAQNSLKAEEENTGYIQQTDSYKTEGYRTEAAHTKELLGFKKENYQLVSSAARAKLQAMREGLKDN